MAAQVRSHRDLQIWTRSVELAVAIYGITTRFPSNEQYGLTSQMRRAAVSVPSNIAEGFYRSTTRDFIHFLSVAKGSLMELETQLVISGKLRFLDQTQLDRLIAEIGEIERMIASMRGKLSSH
jgi:four helix bundle protein